MRLHKNGSAGAERNHSVILEFQVEDVEAVLQDPDGSLVNVPHNLKRSDERLPAETPWQALQAGQVGQALCP